MAMPRSKYVQAGQEGVYHCFSRCVRRAFLYGFDALTLRDFSHRKAWIVDRLRYLAAIFAIEVCAYAIMENHYHAILRTRPDIVASWSDREVASRWLTLFPSNRNIRGVPISSTEQEINALAGCPERIAQLRLRLCSLSWFMGRLNEFIARAANKEDGVKGRFWESRFKCQALLDEAAIAACMVYVDLNPIRSGMAGSPEESDFTSIQERIRAWQKQSNPILVDGNTRALLENTPEIPGLIPDSHTGSMRSADGWLCPIHSDEHRRGILQMTIAEYFDLVDKSGRGMRSDKRGAMDADMEPILLRIGANPETWPETVSCFGSKFCLVAGLASNLSHLARHLGKRWFKGTSAARAAFSLSSLRFA